MDSIQHGGKGKSRTDGGFIVAGGACYLTKVAAYSIK